MILGLTVGLKTAVQTGSGFGLSFAGLSGHLFCKINQNNRLTLVNESCFIDAQQSKTLI